MAIQSSYCQRKMNSNENETFRYIVRNTKLDILFCQLLNFQRRFAFYFQMLDVLVCISNCKLF